MLARATGRLTFLRKASPRDCERVWQINNDPTVRAVSRHTEPISEEEHRRWFLERLTDPASVLYMIVDESSSAIGVIRLESGCAHTEVSVAIDPVERGRGVGRAAIRAAVALASTRWPGLPVVACIAEDNLASRRCFVAAGFRQVAVATSESRMFCIYRRDPAQETG